MGHAAEDIVAPSDAFKIAAIGADIAAAAQDDRDILKGVDGDLEGAALPQAHRGEVHRIPAGALGVERGESARPAAVGRRDMQCSAQFRHVIKFAVWANRHAIIVKLHSPLRDQARG